MRSDLPARVSIAFVALAACHGGVHDLGGAPDPILTIHVRLGAPLPSGLIHPRGGILWAGVPVYVPYCQESGPNPAQPSHTVSAVAKKACRDPFEVVPGIDGPSVALDPLATSFDIPILHLPPAAAMVGRLPSRVAYGSIIVYDDRNGDGALTFSRCGNFGDRGDTAVSTTTTATIGATVFEPIYASSFSTLTNEETRLAYVEGDFDKSSFFYPNPSCEVLPPRGFSMWIVGALLDSNATCMLAPIDREVVVEPMTADSLVDLACPEATRDAFPREPPARAPMTNPMLLWECTPEGGLATANDVCACPNLRLYTLKGCSADDACPIPEWNVPPPPYWPCSTSGSGS
jgi:hypothetical protein